MKKKTIDIQYTHHLQKLSILQYIHVIFFINVNNLPPHTVARPQDEIPQPCNPSPCGSNAVCKERNGAGACSCLPDYFGDPYSGCRPECVTNNDCPRTNACLNNKCFDPCPGVCGRNAECRVINHAPQCTCVIGFTGNPLTGCHEPRQPPSKILPRFLMLSGS